MIYLCQTQNATPDSTDVAVSCLGSLFYKTLNSNLQRIMVNDNHDKMNEMTMNHDKMIQYQLKTRNTWWTDSSFILSV